MHHGVPPENGNPIIAASGRPGKRLHAREKLAMLSTCGYAKNDLQAIQGIGTGAT